uniref:Predicted gene 28553 n=1 Tax=Mus musculus TaxID=10090 RepID=A0A087WRK3_MOUSE
MRRMALKKLKVIPKEGYLLLLDFDDEDDDIKVSEEALSEVKSPAFDKNENISPQAEADEDMGDEVDSILDKSEVNNPAIGKDENTSPQVKGDEDMGHEVGSMLDKSGDDIYKTLHIKRKWMETYVKESFKGSNQKLERFCKTNERERKNINNKFCEQYITTFQKSDMDVQKFNEEKEKSVNSCQKEQQALKLSKCSQNQTLEAVKEMHEKSMEVLMNLGTKN